MRTRRSSRIAAVFAALFLLGTQSFGAACRDISEIWSNNMRLLAAGGDTLWVASLGSQGWGVNYTLNRGIKWQGQSLGCLESGVASIAFGNGTLLVIQNPGSDMTRTSVWTYNIATGRTAAFDIKFHDSVVVMFDSSGDKSPVSAVNGVYAAGKMFFACQKGGLVTCDLQGGALRGALPGESVPFDPAKDIRNRLPLLGSSTATVYSVDFMKTVSGTKILCLTGPKLWLCDSTLSAWDSSITSSLADSSLAFKGFGYAFVNNNLPAGTVPLLYAAINYTQQSGGDTLSSLFRYHFGSGAWTLALKDAPRAITPAVRGFLYAVSGANQIGAYRDSIADTAAVPATGLTQSLTDADFIARMYKPGNLAKPDSIQDLLFVKKSDSTGNIYIAASGGAFSSDGLYSSYDENPGVTTDTFRLDRHAKEIKSGLGETYALPGIISDSYLMNGAAATAMFIYRLGRDARVTIKIYDYSMRHVKTVIDNEPRKAMPTGRSTDQLRDVWDATTVSGRPVAPGIYYYKITTSTGERAFGKIVVAKGRSE